VYYKRYASINVVNHFKQDSNIWIDKISWDDGGEKRVTFIYFLQNKMPIYLFCKLQLINNKKLKQNEC